MTSQWPVVCCRFLSGGRKADEAVAEFRKVFEIHEALKVRAPHDSISKACARAKPLRLALGEAVLRWL